MKIIIFSDFQKITSHWYLITAQNMTFAQNVNVILRGSWRNFNMKFSIKCASMYLKVRRG